MNGMASATDLDPHALAALLHFYAESGVSELCEDVVIDRFEQSQQILQARNRPQPQAAPGPGVSSAHKPGLAASRQPVPASTAGHQKSRGRTGAAGVATDDPRRSGVRGRPGAG
jgi:hypothetical protein